MASFVALARKWRPKQFTDVVGQSVVIQALTNAIHQDRLHHAYLFTGTRGVGKTTIARILAKCLNCQTGITASPCGTCSHCVDIDNGRFPDLFEIDAASRTKVEDTRDILDNVPYAPTVGRFKIYLIDEVHMLSGHSFNALLKTLEEPPAHVKFILATTDPQKLPATILSRCLQFHLGHLSAAEIDQQLRYILTTEQIAFDVPATLLISKAAQGSLRDALSLLDQCIAFGGGAVLIDTTSHLLGTVDQSCIHHILQALAAQDGNQLLDITASLGAQGINFSTVLADLLTQLHDIALVQLAPNRASDEAITMLARQLSAEDIQLYYQIGLIGQRDLDYAPTPQNGFEMTLLRMLAFTPSTTTPTLDNTVVQKKSAELAAGDPVKESKSGSWKEIFEALALTGTARLLAEQCSLIQFAADRLELALHPKYKALLQDATLQRMREAINVYFGRAVTLSVTVTEADMGDVPAELNRRDIKKVQDQATEALYSDSTVQHIIKAFDAKIIKDTIKPIK